MNKLWPRNYDDGVVIIAQSGTQVASLAHVTDENGVVKTVPGAMTEIAFSTDKGMLQAILDRTTAVTAEIGEPEVQVNRYVRAYGWSAPDAEGGRRFLDRGAFVRVGQDEDDVANQLIRDLAELLRKPE